MQQLKMTDTKSTFHVNQYHSECFQSLMHIHIIMCDMTTWLYVCTTNCKTLSKILWIFLRIEITHPQSHLHDQYIMFKVKCLRVCIHFFNVIYIYFSISFSFVGRHCEHVACHCHISSCEFSPYLCYMLLLYRDCNFIFVGSLTWGFLVGSFLYPQ